jgi:hypothetical protein
MDARLTCNADEGEVRRSLEAWPELSERRVRPLFVSAFGDIYFEAESGEVHVVDTVELEVSLVASSPEAFVAQTETEEWRDRLMADLVLLACDGGLALGPNEAYGLTPHPWICGTITVEQLQPMPLSLWHRLCSQLRHGSA